MPVVEVNATDYAANVSSYLISSTSQSSDSSAIYSDRESGTETRQRRIQDQRRFSNFSAPGRPSTPDSGSSEMESEMEISQLEKLLASGSAVIMKGGHPILTPSNLKSEDSSETSESSYVHSVGDGLGEIYHDYQPRFLVTRSTPRSIEHPYYLHDPIFYTHTSVPEESWLRVWSLPNIHQAYNHCTIKESLEDSTAAANGQTEGCDSASCYSSDQVRYSKEISVGVDDFSVATSQTERCDSVPRCSSDRVYRSKGSKVESSESCDSDARYAGSVELIASGTGCERRALGRFSESMYNIGTCSDYFSEGVYRSWPCIHPSWMFSNMESRFSGLTGASESSYSSLSEDHLQCDANMIILSNQSGSIQRRGDSETEFEAESHVDFVQGKRIFVRIY